MLVKAFPRNRLRGGLFRPPLESISCHSGIFTVPSCIVGDMEIVKFTQRMPADLAARLDAYADAAGIGRNGAINVLISQALGLLPVPAQRAPFTGHVENDR